MSVRRTRNHRKLYYCLFDPNTEHIVLDENGNETGEVVPHYGQAVEMWANISPAIGSAQFEQFGNLGNYDKVIVTTDMDCPIDESSVLFIDTEPEYTNFDTHTIVEGYALYADDEILTVRYELPKYNYIVKRVAVGLDAISIAVRKVEIS